MGTCQFCGNDDAVVQTCFTCLAPTPEPIARVIANELGGTVEEYLWLGEFIAIDLGWSRPDDVGTVLAGD